MSAENTALEHAQNAQQELARIEDAFNGYLPSNIADFMDVAQMSIRNLVLALERKVRP